MENEGLWCTETDKLKKKQKVWQDVFLFSIFLPVLVILTLTMLITAARY